MTGYLNLPVVLLNQDYCIDGATIVDELAAERAMVKKEHKDHSEAKEQSQITVTVLGRQEEVKGKA